MGTRSIPALEAAKRATKNRHHRAFVDRVIARIKSAVATGGDRRARDRQAMMRMFRRGGRNLDIDRLAMEADLTFAQMAKIEPILKKAEKDLADLMTAFRETRSWGDRDAWDVLREEQKRVTDAATSDLRRHVDPRQARILRKQVGNVSSRGGMGSGHDGGRGGDRDRRRDRPDR